MRPVRLNCVQAVVVDAFILRFGGVKAFLRLGFDFKALAFATPGLDNR